MDQSVELWEKPQAAEIYMIAGWRQWADAGNISSGFPRYLVEHTGARHIGRIAANGFYLFQIPGTHHLLRPEIKLEEGYRQELRKKRNDIFYAGTAEKGLVIFLGDEPQLHEERYAEAFFDLVKTLGVKRVAAVGGVYAAMPYDKAREVSCIYSLPSMKAEMARYAVKFSDYEGGVTIGTYLASEAEAHDIELMVTYAFVPAYDFSPSPMVEQGVRVEDDYTAWHELMRRFNRMFGLWFDLSDLEQKSAELVKSLDAQVEELDQQLPQLRVRDQIDQLSQNFVENPFTLLDDMWEQELGDILGE